MDAIPPGTSNFQHSVASTQTLSYSVLAVVSLLVSTWLIAVDPVINDEAIVYLRAAQAWINSGFAASFDIFQRPLMPMAMAVIHQLTGLSLVLAGQLLVSLMYVILSLSFVTTVVMLGGSRRTQLFAALLVLVHPLLCDLRSDILREPAYWTFMLLALQQLLHYCHRPERRFQLRWYACIVVAALFQLEALILATLTPLALLWALPRRQRIAAGLKLILPTWLFMTALVASGGFEVLSGSGVSLFAFDVNTWRAIASPATHFQQLANSSLPHLAYDPDIGWAVAGGLLGLLLASALRAAAAPVLVLLLLGWWRKSYRQIPDAARSLINTHIGVSLLYLAAFVFISESVLERHTGIAVIFLLLYLPFILDELWDRAGPAGKTLAAAVLVMQAASSFHNNKFEQQHIAHATRWLQDNTPADATLFSNSPYIAWFSQRAVDWPINTRGSLEEIFQSGSWQEYQFLAFSLSQAEFTQWYELSLYPQLEIMRVFENQHRDLVVVIQNTGSTSRR